MLDATSEAEEVEEAMSISDLKSAREFIGEVAQKASSLEDYQKIIAYIDVMGENGLSPSAMDALVREYIPDDVLEQLYGGGAGVTIDDLYLPDKQAITDMNDLINKAASGSPLSPEERARYNAMLAMVGA